MSIRISAKSIWILERIDEHIRYCNIRGPIECFLDAAADPLDGLAIRAELDDLIRRRLLTIVDYGFDDSMGRDPMRDSHLTCAGHPGASIQLNASFWRFGRAARPGEVRIRSGRT
jgi:hypothetical protein